MNKLYIDGIIYSLQKHGGISTVFNELITRLPFDFYNLILYNNNNFKHNQSTNNLIYKQRTLERYRQISINSEYKLFHSTYYRNPVQKNLKIIQTVHDFIYERFHNGIKRRVHVLQKSNAIKNADIIICVSNNTKIDLLNYYGANLENKCKVIHNAASTDFFQLNYDCNKSQVLYIGNRSGYKNFKSLVLALKNLLELNLVIVGSSLTKDDLFFLHKYLPKRFTYLGHLTNEELNIQYNISLCLVYPSLYEGFGIPILEAMQSGCPVLAINNSSIPEIIPDKNYLLEIGSIDEIQLHLNKMTNLDYRNKFINYGLMRSEQFNWEKTYSKTFQIYNSLL
jgi:mannosyltransferase